MTGSLMNIDRVSSQYTALLLGALIVASCCAGEARAQSGQAMGFFITSEGPGNGADLGGLAGADQHCQTLAAGVGAADRSWRAYLSTTPENDQAGIDARARIGQGRGTMPRASASLMTSKTFTEMKTI